MYFGYMTIVSATFFCLTGTIGFYATYIVSRGAGGLSQAGRRLLTGAATDACNTCAVLREPRCLAAPLPTRPAPQFIRRIYGAVKID